MEKKPLKQNFRVHVWGYSPEVMEIELFIHKTRDAHPAIQSFFQNIFYYLTTKLNLNSEHLYIFVEVELEEKV